MNIDQINLNFIVRKKSVLINSELKTQEDPKQRKKSTESPSD